MKVIISQRGARHRYLIPLILEESGYLECLYTDSYDKSCLGNIARFLSNLGIKNNNINRLLKRSIPLPPEKIKSTDLLFIKQIIGKFLHFPLKKRVLINYEACNRPFIKWGFGNANCLYSMFIDNFKFVEKAKREGLKIIIDIYENPYIFKELIDEIDQNNEYKCVEYLKDQYHAYSFARDIYFDKILSIANKLVVPSNYVLSCIKKSPNFELSKVSVIPYPSSINSSDKSVSPILGRIIWVGNDSVRKGLVYCQRAAKQLKMKYPNIDFRIIGRIENEIKNSKDFSDLNFIGILNKQELEKEYELADIFVFPTLAEGFAGTVLEAASYGIPIITTHNSGCDDDFPAIFINSKNHIDIVKSVSELIEDRVKRNFYSKRVSEYIETLSSQNYKNKIIKLIEDVEKN